MTTASTPEERESENILLFARPRQEVNPVHRRLARELLNTLGFDVQVVNEEELRTLGALLQPKVVVIDTSVEENKEIFDPSFFDITDPEQYLTREHFMDYRNKSPETVRNKVMRTFSYMIDCSGHADWQKRKAREDGIDVIEPLPGIEVETDRTQLGFPLLAKPLDRMGTADAFKNYAIRAGSIINASGLLEESGERLNGREIVIIGMAKQLEYQFLPE